MADAIARFFDDLIVAVARFALGVVAPLPAPEPQSESAASPGSAEALPDSATLVAHFQSLRESGVPLLGPRTPPAATTTGAAGPLGVPPAASDVPASASATPATTASDAAAANASGAAATQSSATPTTTATPASTAAAPAVAPAAAAIALTSDVLATPAPSTPPSTATSQTTLTQAAPGPPPGSAATESTLAAVPATATATPSGAPATSATGTQQTPLAGPQTPPGASQTPAGGAQTPPGGPQTPAAAQSPVPAGFEPGLLHAFTEAHALEAQGPGDPAALAGLSLSPARSGHTVVEELHALNLPMQRAPESLASPWAQLMQSPVLPAGAATSQAQSASATPQTASRAGAPVAASPSTEAHPAEGWPELPQWPLPWDEAAPVPRVPLRNVVEASWYV